VLRIHRWICLAATAEPNAERRGDLPRPGPNGCQWQPMGRAGGLLVVGAWPRLLHPVLPRLPGADRQLHQPQRVHRDVHREHELLQVRLHRGGPHHWQRPRAGTPSGPRKWLILMGSDISHLFLSLFFQYIVVFTNVKCIFFVWLYCPSKVS
jgi:hypothetical protein